MGSVVTTLRPRAINIQKTLGTRAAAGFLRNRGVSLQEALFALTGKCIVRGGV